MKLWVYILLAFFSWALSQAEERHYPNSEITENWNNEGIDVWEIRTGTVYPSGIYCSYPRPHFRIFGPCPSFIISSWKIDFNRIREKPNPAEQYINQLFDTAFLGSARSQYLLGYRYHKGKTFKEDPIKAFAWYSLADQNGHSSALFMRNLLAHEMTDEQLEEGQMETVLIQEKIDENIMKRQEELNNILADPQDLEFNNLQNPENISNPPF